jgi:hypothetical protein
MFLLSKSPERRSHPSVFFQATQSGPAGTWIRTVASALSFVRSPPLKKKKVVTASCRGHVHVTISPRGVSALGFMTADKKGGREEEPEDMWPVSCLRN